MPQPERHPWERQPGESSVLYDRFEVYLKLGSDRSINQACYQYKTGKDQEEGKPPRNHRPGKNWYEDASKWNWEARAIAWDDWQRQERKRKEKEAEARERKARIEAKEQRLKRAAEHLEVEWDLSNQLIRRAKDMLNHPLYTRTISDNGQTIILTPAKWAMKDAVAMIKLASELGRSATGLDSNMTELEGAEVLARAGFLNGQKLVAIEDEATNFQKRIGEIIGSDLVVDAEPGENEIQLEELDEDE